MISLIASLFIPLVAVSEVGGDCANLEMEDPMLGTLLPCTHPKAQGMLCVKAFPDVVVWPEKKESALLNGCGFSRTSGRNSKRRRRRHLFTSRARTERTRKRRETFDLNVDDHLSEGYDFQKMLKDLIKMEYGKGRLIQIDPAAELFIKTNVQLAHNSQMGIYRALVGPASQFDPEAKNKARDTILKLLKGKAKKEDWGWLDVERMGRELEMCYYADYSAVTNQDVFFTTPKQNVQLEVETNQSRSSLGYWYFKVVCMREGDRIFLTTVIYTDQMKLADIEKTVQFWRNNPETVVKFIKGTKERLVKAIDSQIVADRRVETDQSCHTVKKGWWFLKKRKTVCHPTRKTSSSQKTLALIKQKILKDVTQKKFLYEVNNWVKSTKAVMERRTLNLREREALKDWLHNIVLTEIIHHFSQFLNEDGDVISISDPIEGDL